MPEHLPSENPSGAGNEQGSLTDHAWLAGLLDGDGWIGIIRARRTGKTYYRYTASLALMSTSDRLTEKVKQVLEDMGVNVYVAAKAAYVGSDGSPRRAKWTVSTRGNADTAIALSLLHPFLVEKKRCAELVIDYVDWRMRQPHRPGGHAEKIIFGMREKAEETMSLLREDRNRHDPSTTTRLAPVLAG